MAWGEVLRLRDATFDLTNRRAFSTLVLKIYDRDKVDAG